MVHRHKGILLSDNKELNWVTCSDVDEPRVYHAEQVREKQIYMHTYVRNLGNGTDEPILREGTEMQQH